MKRIALLIVCFCVAVGVRAQTYHIVPSGDPANPYRIEQIAPPVTFNVSTFDEAIQALRNSEGVDPARIVPIMQDPTNPAPAVLCSLPDATVQLCANTGMTVQ